MEPYNKCTLFIHLYTHNEHKKNIYKKKKIPMNNDQDHRKIIQHRDMIEITYVLVKY